jgi:phospholipid-binding lipoprotein MlaA
MVRTRAAALAVALATCLLMACGHARPPSPEHDPIEGFNRKMFWFNDKLDVYVLEPVATGWDFVAPDPVQNSVSNFFANLRFPIIAINDLLQGKWRASAVDVGRFGVNTTVGVLGFFDPAAHWGLEEHFEDFGQTLGVWGVPPGPYLVIPFLGPSSPRDAAGVAVDTALSVTPWFVDTWILVAARVVDVVNERSLVLKDVRDLRAAAIDYYVLVRNGYFQRRAAMVNDRAAPAAEDDLYYPDAGAE